MIHSKIHTHLFDKIKHACVLSPFLDYKDALTSNSYPSPFASVAPYNELPCSWNHRQRMRIDIEVGCVPSRFYRPAPLVAFTVLSVTGNKWGPLHDYIFLLFEWYPLSKSDNFLGIATQRPRAMKTASLVFMSKHKCLWATLCGRRHLKLHDLRGVS